jgi:hypothetical protein
LPALVENSQFRGCFRIFDFISYLIDYRSYLCHSIVPEV